MPFLGQNMTPIGGNSRAGEVASQNAPMGWAYQSLTDDRATLQATGYFDPFNKQLVAGQFIYTNLTDGKFIFTILSVDRGLTQVDLDVDVFFPSASPPFDVDTILTNQFGEVLVNQFGNVLVSG